MDREVILWLWEESKDNVKKVLQKEKNTHKMSYKYLLKIILEQFNNILKQDKTYSKPLFKPQSIATIDFGDYQGTLILAFCLCSYQPNIYESFYTYVEYGSCSVCDTLQNILYSSQEKYFNEQQIKDLMSLALHLAQHIKTFDWGV